MFCSLFGNWPHLVHKTQDKDKENTKHTTIRKQTQIRHQPCYNQLGVQTNRTACQERSSQHDWENDIMFCSLFGNWPHLVHKTQDKDKENTKHTTIRKQTQIRHQPCYNQLEVQTNRTACQERSSQHDWENDIMFCSLFGNWPHLVHKTQDKDKENTKHTTIRKHK
jgi:hypothetical protein